MAIPEPSLDHLGLYGVRGFRELHAWVKDNAPELHARLVPLKPRNVRRVLNSVTGLEISEYESIADTAPKFLAALKVCKALGKIR